MKFYLAYGSNLNIDKMKLRCPKAKPLNKVNGIKINKLFGWKLVFNRYATIIRDKNSFVPIGIYKITKFCEKSLDLYEGYPQLYSKVYLIINSTRFMTYVLNNHGLLKPSKTYLNEIKKGYNNFCLDINYLKKFN